MDSECTFHITPNRDLVFYLEEFEGGKILMWKNTFSELKSIAKIMIDNNDGSYVVLT